MYFDNYNLTNTFVSLKKIRENDMGVLLGVKAYYASGMFQDF